MKVVARTRRLLLREIADSDEEALGRWFADPATMTFYPSTRDRKQTREWMAAQRACYAQLGYGLWAACDRASAALVGYCGLAQQEVESSPEIEVGYLIRRDLWGQGLASEAARAALRLARRRFGRARPVALIDPRNAASIRVAEKIGMRLEGETVKWGKTLRVYRAVGRTTSPVRG